MIDAFGERYGEWVAFELCAVLAPLRCDRRERHGALLYRCRRLSSPERLVDETPNRGFIAAIGRGETPCAFVHDAETDSPIGGSGGGFDCSVLAADGLVLPLYGARVRVCRAARSRDGDEIGDTGIARGHARK